jgi:hypothetical protein
VLFVPIFFGMKYLYGAWLNAPPSGERALSEFQRAYLTPNGFRVRAILYFVVWLILVFLFNRWSREQDVNREDRGLRRRLKMLAGPGIILYVFVMSFAAIDWSCPSLRTGPPLFMDFCSSSASSFLRCP